MRGPIRILHNSEDSRAISTLGPASLPRSKFDRLFRFIGLFAGFVLALGHNPPELNVHESHFGPTGKQMVCLVKDNVPINTIHTNG